MSRLSEVAFHECQTKDQQTGRKSLRELPRQDNIYLFIPRIIIQFYLKNSIVSLQLRGVFLNKGLLFFMEGDVVADCFVVAKIDLTHLGYVEALGNDNKHSLAQGKEEHTRLNCDPGYHLSYPHGG